MITEITAKEFDKFSKKHFMSNFRQTSNYATVMVKAGYDHTYIGFYENNIMTAAALLLTKKIKRIFKYAYIPQGFIIDYNNIELFSRFTNEFKKYCKKNKIIFAKVNPEIPINLITKDYKKKKLTNHRLYELFEKNGYTPLKKNLYFEAMLPRHNAVINLDKYEITNIDKTNRNLIYNAERKGLEFIVKNNEEGIKELYNVVKLKKRRSYQYYKHYFNTFNDEELADIFLIYINHDKQLKISKYLYEKEVDYNKKLTELMFNNNSEKNVKKKIASDKVISSLKNDIINATYGTRYKSNEPIAGAICIKHQNSVHIIISGYNKVYSSYNPNYFLHNEIFKYYKKLGYSYIDLNGITGDFTDSNPYKGLNNFKRKFNPDMYEFIGEFDLVINETLYDTLLNLELIQNEFKKD